LLHRLLERCFEANESRFFLRKNLSFYFFLSRNIDLRLRLALIFFRLFFSPLSEVENFEFPNEAIAVVAQMFRTIRVFLKIGF
jgi:hypothetical protein